MPRSRGRPRPRPGRAGSRAAEPSATLRPCTSTTTLSQIAATRPMWCSTSSTLSPRSARSRRITSPSASTSSCTRPEASSSSSSSRGCGEQRAGQLDPLHRPVRQRSGRPAGQLGDAERARASPAPRRPAPARPGGRPASAPRSATEPGRAAGCARRRRTLSSTVASGCSTGVLERAGHAEPGQPVRRGPQHVGAVDQHRPGRRPVEPGDAVEQRRLAGPVRPDQAADLAGGDGQVDAVERAQPAEGEAEPTDVQQHGRRVLAGLRQPPFTCVQVPFSKWLR